MFFNPLFISSTNANTGIDVSKDNRFTNSNYLFADIINISREKVSLTETNVELDKKNKTLFNDCNITLAKDSKSDKNQFMGKFGDLSTFLSNVLGSKIEQNESFPKKNDNKSSDLSVVPEHVTQLVDVLNGGDKLSIPLENNGETIFVEIEKVDENFATKENTSRGVKLGATSNNNIQFSKLNINQVVDDISTALRTSFGSNNSKLNDTKIETIIKRIKNSFSNLVAINNETFQPKKNVLGNLVSSIEREFNLNAAESSEIKNVIVAEFAKVINEYIENENSVSIADVEKNKTLPVINGIKPSLFTGDEQKLIEKFGATVVNSKKVKKKIESNFANDKDNIELKSILDKFEKHLSPLGGKKNNNSLNISFVQKLPLEEISKELNLTPKELKIVKNLDVEQIDNSKLEYLFTLKSKKTLDGVVLTDDMYVEKKNTVSLEKSIYTSKETAELTNVKVFPINTKASKNEAATTDYVLKKNLSHMSKKNVELSDTAVSETTKQKVKKSETILPRTSMVDHQVRDNIFSISEKVLLKRVDVKNIREEISNLISKGKKKSVEFQLNPENLGKMAVKLEVVNKVVTASIRVDNEMAQQLVQNGLEGLKASLNSNGVQFNSLNVSLFYSEDKNQKYFKQKRKNNNTTHGVIAEVDEQFVRKNLGYNNYDFIA